LALTTVLRDVKLLFPDFAKQMMIGVERANADGHKIAIFESFRTAARQQKLWDQGRMTNGPIVTNSKPWQSWHQYGLAADIAGFDNGKWNWNFDPFKISKYFEDLGLVWLGEKDPPHYQYANLPRISAAQAIVAENQSILAFWASLI
jgi:hypothetical protein